jgi:hypothetical protein
VIANKPAEFSGLRIDDFAYHTPTHLQTKMATGNQVCHHNPDEAADRCMCTMHHVGLQARELRSKSVNSLFLLEKLIL